jgi:hypothetical protein
MTIIGRGDIASVIPDRPDRLYFAAGVSNSGETRESEYQREYDLLVDVPSSFHVVYFSSLCVFYGDSRYARHKQEMEQVVQETFRTSTIMRLGAITWGSNPYTLINYMRARHAAKLTLDIQDVYRVVHTLADFQYALSIIPNWSCEMHAPGRLMKVADIVSTFVRPTWALASSPVARS